MSDVLGVGFYVAVALLGIVSTVLISVWVWRFLQRRHVRLVLAVPIVGLAVLLAFLGLWLVFDLAWVAAAAVRLAVRLRGQQSMIN